MGRTTPDASLRSRILEASLDLLEKEGLAALSMREVARRAGVSHQAPYHHFEDREAILAALVTDGFDDLAGRLHVAWEKAGRENPHDAIIATGMAYVKFALERPGVFRIMFRPEHVYHARFPEAEAAGNRAFAVLEAMIDVLGGEGSRETRISVLWSLVHGLATLMVDGKLGAAFASRKLQKAHAQEVLAAFAQTITGSSSFRAAP